MMKIRNVIESGASIVGASSFKSILWTAAVDAIGGAAAPLIAGYVSRKNTKDTNKMNLQIAREANEQQHILQQENNQFQHDMAIEMFNKENEYNSPVAAMSRLRAAGLNPYMGNTGSSMVQSSTGDIATPSGTSPLPVHAPTMQVEPSILGTAFQNFKTISEAFKTLSEAKKVGLDTTLLQEEFDDLVKDQHEKALTDEYIRKLRATDLEWLPKKYQKDIEQVEQAIALALAQTVTENSKRENFDMDTSLKRVQTQLEHYNIRLTYKQIQRIGTLLPLEKETEKQRARSLGGSAAAGYASAEKSHEEAKTVRELRPELVASAQKDNQLKDQQVRAEIFRNNFNDETRSIAIKKLQQELQLNDAEMRQIEANAAYAQTQNDWYWFDHTLGAVLGSAGNAVAAYILKKQENKPLKQNPKRIPQYVEINGKRTRVN